MFLHSNINALTAHKNWMLHNNKIAQSMQRLSSGCRINSAADDPAGLAVSEKLKAQLTRLGVDKRNAIDYQSMLDVADGSLGEVQSMLDRMSELANQAMNGTLSETERGNLNAEYQQLLDEVNRIGRSSSFGGTPIFGKSNSMGGTTGIFENTDASESGDTTVIIGGNLEAYLDSLDELLLDISSAAKENNNDKLLSLGIDRSNGKTDAENLKNAVLNFTKENGQKLLNTPGSDGNQYKLILSDGNIEVKMPTVSGDSLGLEGSNLLTGEDARKAAEALKNSINLASSWRGSIGAAYNRLEHTINNISNMESNLTDALSRILDTDMAAEMMTLAKEQVLAQASMFVMAQANQQPEQVLTLINSM